MHELLWFNFNVDFLVLRHCSPALPPRAGVAVKTAKVIIISIKHDERFHANSAPLFETIIVGPTVARQHS